MSAPKALLNYIEGQWENPAVRLAHDICNANSGESIMGQSGSETPQIDRAIRAADLTHRDGSWRELAAAGRATKLLTVAEALDELVADIAAVDAVTTGAPITQTRQLAAIPALAFRRAAALTVEPARVQRGSQFDCTRLPLGPALIIAPWNAPAGIASHKIASALAAGCPVLFKPSEWSPLSGQLIAQAISRAGLPPGTFQLLHGDGRTGAAMAEDDRVAAVSFTGGLEAGRAVAAACAHRMRPAQLELGGNNPLVVLADADPVEVAHAVGGLLSTLNGQWCRAPGRLIVHNSLLEPLLELTVATLGSLRIGASTAEDTQLGPLAHRAHRDSVLAAIGRCEALGGTVYRCGELPRAEGWFLQPALICGLRSEQALDEIFGPVATVHSYADIEQALALANEPPYGLAGYVFGPGPQALQVARRIEAGTIKVNLTTLFGPDPDAPRPVWKLSGIGTEGARETFEFFRGSRLVAVAGELSDYGVG